MLTVDLSETNAMPAIPTCIITGRIVGDQFACGDCDPCFYGLPAVPKVVKDLIAERDEWKRMFEDAMSE